MKPDLLLIWLLISLGCGVIGAVIGFWIGCAQPSADHEEEGRKR